MRKTNTKHNFHDGSRKHFALTAAALLAVSLFSGCGENAADNAPPSNAAAETTAAQAATDNTDAATTTAAESEAPSADVSAATEKTPESAPADNAEKTDAEKAAEIVLNNEALWLDPVNDSLSDMPRNPDLTNREHGVCWFEDLDFDGTPEFIIGGWNPGWQFGEGYVLFRLNLDSGTMEQIYNEKNSNFSSDEYPFIYDSVSAFSDYTDDTFYPGLTGACGADVVSDGEGNYKYVIPMPSESPNGGYFLNDLSVGEHTFNESRVGGYSCGIGDDVKYYTSDGEIEKDELTTLVNDYYSGFVRCLPHIGAIPCTSLMSDKDQAWFEAGADSYTSPERNNKFISTWYDGMTREEKLAALTDSYNAYSLEFNGSWSVTLRKFFYDVDNGEKTWFHEYDF